MTARLWNSPQTKPDQPNITHSYRFANAVSLYKSHPDNLVNILKYWQIDAEGKETRFSWVTDFPLTCENIYQIMRAWRARWRIENETFNILKNQDYNLVHNYGLGKIHLSVVIIHLMMLAFMVDQIHQFSCPLFQTAWQKCQSKVNLWECIRGAFKMFIVLSMEVLLQEIVTDMKLLPH